MTGVAIALLCGLILMVAIFMALWLKSSRSSSNPEEGLAGRIAQLAQLQMQTQQHMENRLAWLSEKVGEKLHLNATETAKSMAEVRERLAIIDAAQKNLSDLSTQVVGLQDILGNKQARGVFGEVQLQDIVQTILAPSNYQFQAPLGENKRVDCLILLPNPPGPIAVDAKFPLEGYRAMREAKDDNALQMARRDFTQAVRKHIRDIAERYIVPGQTAESALMFIPSEAIYAEIHAHFQNLVEEAHRLRVWIVSPTTFMATLTTIRAVLKDVRVREQAGLIQKKVAELVKDLSRLDERVGKLQKHFDQAQDDVRQIRISTDKAQGRAHDIIEAEIEEGASPDLLKPQSPLILTD